MGRAKCRLRQTALPPPATYHLPYVAAGWVMETKHITTRWLKYLLAILLGNGLYFALNPYLPPAAKHHPFKLDLGTLVDFWLCLVIYGLLELGAFLQKRG